MKKQYSLVLKHNSNAVYAKCAICKKHTDAQIGIEIFLEETMEIVCRDCGKKYASELSKHLPYKPSKDELLKEYSQKNHIYHCYQIDGFQPEMMADKDGYGMMSGWIWDLRNTDIPFRVTILEGAKKKDILMLLKKAKEWLKESPSIIENDSFGDDLPF